MPIELMLMIAVKALVELAALFLFGQGVLYILAGQKRNNNFFYQLFSMLTGPVVRMTRRVTPRFVVDRHIPYVAFLLLFWIWLGTLFIMAQFCQSSGIDCKAWRESSAVLQGGAGHAASAYRT
jgi:hypothetical protein